MFYHRNSLQMRLKFPLRDGSSGKPMQESMNEVDGVGNPKGDVYTREELRQLLGALSRARTLRRRRCRGTAWAQWFAVLPATARRALERRCGWFLYAKAIRP